MATAPAGSLYIDIVTSVAKLQADMNAMKRSVGTAVGSVNRDLGQGATSTQRYLDSMERMAGRTGTAMAGMGQQAGLTRGHMMNLGYQVNDLIVSLASGQKPMMVFMQQGSQIAQIGAQAGVGVGGMAKGVASMAGNFARAHPILLAATATLGATAFGFSLLGKEMGKDAHLDSYAKKLGLTKEELAKAGGATVTFGDMLSGLWKTISDGLGLAKVFKSIKDWATDAFTTALKFAKDSAVGIYAYYGAAYDTIGQVWKNLPALLGGAFIGATNAVIEEINRMVRTATTGLNILIHGVNQIPGIELPLLNAPQIGKLKNQYAAAGKAVGDAFKDNFNKRWAEGQAVADRMTDRLTKNIIDAAKARLKAADDEDKVKKKGADKHAEALQREIDSMEAAIKSLWALSDAYEMGEAAAMRAEAAARANEKAIRKEGDFAVFYALELRKAVAERAEAAGKLIGSLNAETAAQAEANRMVAEGLITAEQAGEYMKKEIPLRALLVAMENAQGEELENLQKKYDALSPAIDNNNRARKEAALLRDTENANFDVERLQLELKLLGATNKEREIALAQLEVEQRYNKGRGLDPEKYASYLKAAKDRVEAAHALTDAQDGLNASLERQLDILDALDERARIVANGLAEAFGAPGRAMGDLLTAFTGYAAEREAIETRLAKLAQDKAVTSAAYQAERLKADRQLANMEVAHYGTILTAAKGFFKEGTTGYKVMLKLEQAYAALQLANMIKSLVMDKVQTGSKIANSTARGLAAAAEGAANMFASLGPLGFAAVAAMVGVLASMGLKGLGGGGGKGPTIPTAEETQARQGTGSVLGASDAKSESIARALDLIEKNTNRDLEYSSEMVRSLRAIETNIGGLAALIARQMGVSGGMFDESGLGVGKTTGLSSIGKFALGGIPGLLGFGLFDIVKKIPIIGGVLNTIAKALFGSSKTVTVIDKGLTFAAQSVQDIVNGGVVGNIYQTLQTVKKSKFLGISTGKKTSVSDQTSPLVGGMSNQIALLVASLRDGIVSAAGTIGIEGAAAMLDAFQINIGRISLEGLSGEEIEKELSAVFSRVADDMAGSVVGGLGAFQKVGEGLFETLTRLARDYQTVDIQLQAIGKTFGAVGVASVGARENLIDLFGGLDAFTEATNFFRENFLSEAEQMAPIISAVQAEMNRLGLATIDTKDEFKQTVLGLDLTTEAGQGMFAALMAVAPAFAKTSDYLAKLNGVAEETGQTAQQLAEIAKQRRSLEIQLMEAQGRSEEALAAKRADELAAMDASLRPLQEQVWAAQEAAEAAKALAAAEQEAARAQEALASKRRDLEIRLMEATGNAAGALAARRADELAALDPTLRALQAQIWAAEDAAAANETLSQTLMTAAEIARTRSDLEIALMEATGNAAGALARRRELELAALDPVLHALQQEVWAAQDAAEANQALANVQQTAAEIARTRRTLEIQLMEAEGNAAGALAARRQDELAAIDPTLRALQLQVWAAQDAAEANQALANVQQTAAEIARTRRDLEIRLMEAEGNAAGALAARRADELAALDPLLHALMQQVWAAEDAAAANQALAQVQATAAELARSRREMEIQLLDALGRSEEAEAARRADALAAMDSRLHALQQEIWAAQDAAVAAQALAETQAEAARAAEEAAARALELASTRRDLEIRLMETTGDAAGALAARRADEIAAADSSLRALLQQIYAAEDAAIANQALADAQAAAAQAAEEAAQRTAEAAQRAGELQIELLRAVGREADALAAERAIELAGMDPRLRALQEQVWAAQDAAAAQEALAQAQADAARAAEEAAQAQQALNDKRATLEIALLRATGNEVAALAMERARELAELDPSLRALQLQVWAAQDAAEAIDQHNSSLGDMAAKYRDLATGLREYRASLAGAAALTAEEAYNAAAGQFSALFQKARMGDVDALGGLQGAGQNFIAAARENAASALEYKRSVAFVANAVDQAIGVAEARATDAEKELAALDQQIGLLAMLNGNVVNVHDAIIEAAERGAMSLPPSAYVSGGTESATSGLEQRLDGLATRLDLMVAPIQATAITSKKTADQLVKFEAPGGSVAVSTREGDAVETTGGAGGSLTGPIEVINSTSGGEPVPLFVTSV